MYKIPKHKIVSNIKMSILCNCFIFHEIKKWLYLSTTFYLILEYNSLFLIIDMDI